MITSFKTIAENSEGVYTESGSRFLSFAFPCTDDEFVKQKRLELKKEHHKAVHVVFASRFLENGANEKSSDDGEPSGSAGKPVLNEIKSRELTNIAVFVVRYFGGKKLGIPGLINAYKVSAADALNKNVIVIHEIREFYRLECGENESGAVMHIIHQSGAQVIESLYGETCKFVVSCKRSDQDAVISKISQNRNITIEFIKSV